MLYSAKTNGFYSVDIHGTDVPDDAVEISDQLYRELFDGQAVGKVIAAGPTGEPVLVNPPEPTTSQLGAAALVRRDALLREAALFIAPLQDAIDLNQTTDELRATLNAWKQYRIDLSRIEQQSGYPASIAWPSAPNGSP